MTTDTDGLTLAPPAEPDALYARAVRLIAECAEHDVYEVDLILVNISCNPAFGPLWGGATDGIKALVLQGILRAGLARADLRIADRIKLSDQVKARLL